ncbi:cytochrome c oxidase subunit II [Falsibacillus pallidus]|uniref:cytochrome c oxidase subunit II n=1 Tax=Falsibacillus pallidus TaxID=493781 RepID=UPI003D9577DC
MFRRGMPVFLLFLMAALSGCSGIDVLDPKGPAAREEFGLFQLTIYLMLLVLATVFILFFYFLWKYRITPERKNHIPNGPSGNKKLEITWTVIPIVILIIIAIPTVKSTYHLSEAADAKHLQGKTVIEVTAHQFWWEFHYLDGDIKTSDVLHIPTGEDVVLVIRSDDTIHSLWVPQLGGKMDAVPGKTNRLWVKADEPGSYEGKCAELCGAAHAYMLFTVKAESKQDFQKWKQAMQKKESGKQKTESAAAGEKVFKKNCLSCHAVNGSGETISRGNAPNLTGFAEHDRIASVLPNTKENIVKWINDPKKYKPGTEMPSFKHLSAKEKEELAEYVQSLGLDGISGEGDGGHGS